MFCPMCSQSNIKYHVQQYDAKDHAYYSPGDVGSNLKSELEREGGKGEKSPRIRGGVLGTSIHVSLEVLVGRLN